MTRKLLLAAALVVVPAASAAMVWAHLPPPAIAEGDRVERVVVRKGTRVLELVTRDRVVAEYRVALGREPVGPKRREGDRRTPEGRYVIDYHKPDSSFHLALHVSYPGPEDVARAAAAGEAPGGLIMVHGLHPAFAWLGRLHRFRDWTNGCVAVSNAEIAQIYDAVADGTPIELLP